MALNGRLLCAAGHAYAVTETGPATMRPSGQGSRVQYLSTPHGVLDGDGAGGLLASLQIPAAIELLNHLGQCDAVTLGVTQGEIIVAFRGTIGSDKASIITSVGDWVNNAKARLVEVDGVPGAVHRGFAESLENLWPDVELYLKKLPAAHRDKPVYFTGHSKGGGIAPIAAVRFARAFGRQANVVTFAGPRVGNGRFAEDGRGMIADYRRYEFVEDIVPHLAPADVLRARLTQLGPPWSLLNGMGQGYVSTGDLRLIARDGTVTEGPNPDTEAAYLGRMEALLGLIDNTAERPFEQIRLGHVIDDGSAYYRAICP